SCGTCRSSPRKNRSLFQGMLSENAGAASNSYRPLGVLPPESAIVQYSFVETTSAMASHKHSAAALNRPALSGSTCSFLFAIAVIDRQRKPMKSVAGDQRLGGFRSPGVGRMVRKVQAFLSFSGVDDRHQQFPRSFNLIAAHKQGLVAKHGIEKQRFISFRRIIRIGTAVIEDHIDRVEHHVESRPLCLHL